jgi:hypothetical protein
MVTKQSTLHNISHNGPNIFRYNFFRINAFKMLHYKNDFQAINRSKCNVIIMNIEKKSIKITTIILIFKTKFYHNIFFIESLIKFICNNYLYIF